MSEITEKYGEQYSFVRKLNQANVLEVYKACLVAKEDIGKNPDDEVRTKAFTVESCGKDAPEVIFSKKRLDRYESDIKYLLGQLKVTHKRMEAFTLPMGFINYKNEPWTKDNVTLMALYYLGIAGKNMPQFSRIPNSNDVVSSLQLVPPNFSPDDPICIESIEKMEAERKKEEWEAFVKSDAFQEAVDKLMEENEKKIREILGKARESVRYWESRTMEDIIPDPDLRRRINSNWKLKRDYEKQYAEELQRRKKQLAELEEGARKVGIT